MIYRDDRERKKERQEKRKKKERKRAKNKIKSAHLWLLLIVIKLTYTRIGFVSLIYVLVCQGSVPLVQRIRFFKLNLNFNKSSKGVHSGLHRCRLHVLVSEER